MSLDLDFAPRKAQPSSLRMTLGSMALVIVLALTWSLTGETEAGPPDSHSALPAAEEIRSINAAIDDLNFPWLALMKSLEDSGDDSIRVLQLDADARDLKMTVQGEAQNGNVVLELPERLRRSAVIADARVVSQTPAGSADARSSLLRFALEVSIRAPEGESP